MSPETAKPSTSPTAKKSAKPAKPASTASRRTAAKRAASPERTLVILGASGDLTSRLLLPGLATLLESEPERRVRVLGAAMEDFSPAEWTKRVRRSLTTAKADAEVRERIMASTAYRKTNVLDRHDLGELLEDLPKDSVLYFALPPQVSIKACELLATMELPKGLRLAIEKPFGFDRASAAKFNRLLARVVPEQQTFRIDHFLGKAAVLNLLGLRFGNRIFEPVWNNVNISHVDIVADESLALEGRAGYYDAAGALKDMIQSHLLLIMAMMAMEEIASVDEVELRDLMAHVLRATRLMGSPKEASRRARYTAGKVGRRSVPAYADEPGVDPDRGTETLAEIVVEIRNSRWAGVPFRLRSGKALCSDRRGIYLYFKPISHDLEGLANKATPNVLKLGMSPETIELGVMTNGEGDMFEMENTTLSATIGDSHVRPYGEILAHILDGNPLLSVRGDIAEECWRIVAPVLRAWAADEVPLQSYAAGSAGPKGW
ncbi:glucose-6-phosphate dehydrogenase [Nostocoides sp. F2B08]|uniref:glucose-6-phosphate dehydrogenase n=1 Tax=Nostocoides sp. F2B08 TaxID=2653936 RepID=UPI001262CC3A|nr:glucose-6-phosphate dehydrogenase [Tetrasphaera sp. F2B08]KAB7743926.1 glucose-6-phosphate dehydrogenase [Tetrasphaera sp. F2B08]